MPIPYRPVSRKVLLQERFDEEARLNRRAKAEEKRRAIKESAEAKNRDAMIDKLTSQRVNPAKRDDKFASFTESVRITLFEHAVYKVFYEAMKKVEGNLNREIISESVMHALTYSFIHENGGPSVLISNMNHRGNTTYFLSETKNLVDKAFKSIIESVDRQDVDSYHIKPEILTEFKHGVDCHICDCEVTENIADRVTAAIEDFFKTNAEDKEKIVSALTATKEKIEALNTDDEQLKESYTRFAKKFVADIRNKPKSLFAEMVTAMAESVIKNDELKKEFMTEDNHIDVARLVNKVSMMYGFLETVNTMRLIKVDDKYVQSVLESMRLG